MTQYIVFVVSLFTDTFQYQNVDNSCHRELTTNHYGTCCARNTGTYHVIYKRTAQKCELLITVCGNTAVERGDLKVNFQELSKNNSLEVGSQPKHWIVILGENIHTMVAVKYHYHGHTCTRPPRLLGDQRQLHFTLLTTKWDLDLPHTVTVMLENWRDTKI